MNARPQMPWRRGEERREEEAGARNPETHNPQKMWRWGWTHYVPAAECREGKSSAGRGWLWMILISDGWFLFLIAGALTVPGCGFWTRGVT
jgi:hypothetical protein